NSKQETDEDACQQKHGQVEAVRVIRFFHVRDRRGGPADLHYRRSEEGDLALETPNILTNPSDRRYRRIRIRLARETRPDHGRLAVTTEERLHAKNHGLLLCRVQLTEARERDGIARRMCEPVDLRDPWNCQCRVL